MFRVRNRSGQKGALKSLLMGNPLLPREKSPFLIQALEEADREKPEDYKRYFDRLFPLFRSITGDGARKTHDILSEIMPLQRIETPSGSQVFDWTVPKEWVVREAYVVTPKGERILDIRDSNLHLVNYSQPFRGKVSREELDKHLHSLPELPAAVPYVISYYAPRWGFCLTQNMRDRLEDGEYEVVIDTEHIDGSMTISETVLPGEETKEVLITAYTCHPSMANHELSGPLVTAFVHRRLASLPKRRLTYRFVYAPETIGSITYLSLRGEHLLKNLAAGYVCNSLGMPTHFTCKKTRRENSLSDRAALHALPFFGDKELQVREFFPSHGSDERQYNSPGFNLPVGVLARTIYGEYPEYHTSLDNPDFISFEALAESADAIFAVCSVLDKNAVYERTMPYCEPFMTKYGLYPTLSGRRKIEDYSKGMMWLLNYADGEHDLLSIAERSGFDFWMLDDIARVCLDAGIIRLKK